MDEMPKQPKDMTLTAMQAEFRTLADEIAEPTARRSEIDTEMKKRINKAAMQAHIEAMTPEDKEALLFALKQDMGLQ